ncbi:MAG: uroporphyrinogen decarboxylase family protein [Oscillospiraceae bacterium]|nr:uroporphyrinogen decarboxylase family protein [Oscillospiraceae bacterium]
MTKKERVIAAIQGGPVDHIPSGFWLHFPETCFYGDSAVKAHLDFFRETGTDIQKIMNENLVPCDIPIKKAADWKNLKPFSRHSPFIVNQVELIKRILEQTGGEGMTLATVHGIVASAWHARGGSAGYETGSSLLAAHLREDPKAVSYGWEVLSDGLAILTEACLEAGADGIYYAALGGETYLFTDEEFETYIKPHDLKILKAAEKSPYNILHICKDRLNLERYRDYPCAVVNWGVYEQNPSLQVGAALFSDKVILGGLDDRAGVLIDGDETQIKAAVQQVLHTMEGRRFILGADCTLPTEIAYSRIHTAVVAAK